MLFINYPLNYKHFENNKVLKIYISIDIFKLYNLAVR